jgi:xylulokinase
VPLYLGLDSSTQSLTAIVIDVEPHVRRVVWQRVLNFDADLPRYGTRHGIRPNSDPSIAEAPPLMWADALEQMMEQLSSSGLDLARLDALAGSAQQHGSVYLNARAAPVIGALDAQRALVDQISGIFARTDSPIWMDTSTATQCAEITAAVGGADALRFRSGSRAFERFTGPQIRRFSQAHPEAYAATDRIHLVSSFLASLLIGRHAPIDTGDGSGMNLMDLRTARWWPEAVNATAPGLAEKLPAIVRPWTTVGTISPYWQKRFGLPPANVVAWSGDNPCSLIGTGLIKAGTLAVSLGTSDTVFGPMDEPRVAASGEGHVFGAPTGAFMGLTCFQNGSLARERVREMFGMTWREFSDALAETPPGNDGRIMLPWFEPEITPPVLMGNVHRFGLSADDAPANVRAVVEAQQIAMARHSRWIAGTVTTIHATGGAAVNREILQVMADVSGADVYQFAVGNSAALGAALRALHAAGSRGDRPAPWDDVVRELAEPVPGSRVQPDAARHAIYRRLMDVHAACEAHALGRGDAPTELIEAFRRSIA